MLRGIMSSILEKLCNVENVLAVFLRDGDKITKSFLPENISLEIANTMSSLLNKATNNSYSKGFVVNNATFFFDRYLFIHSHLSSKSQLNVICNRNVNQPLLEVALSEAFHELKEHNKKRKKSLTVEDVMAGSLAFPIERLQDIYYDYVGPVAEIIVIESIEKWITKEIPRLSNLINFVDIMVEEVEPSERKAFVDKAQKLIEKVT